ncbi:MAG: class I SAM-dependent methyltransferase, partial [Oscillospiraceae bacterium]|nr:class I SAM-dependent methyltransferase [Oscillospiraceae bacterium]
MWVSDNWQDYELLDASDGERLERWGEYILIRPDPQIIWKGMKQHKLWKNAHAVYNRSQSGGGSWKINKLPEEWTIGYKNLKFIIHPTGFKHTGLFPEQAVNWDWMSGLINGKSVKVLNLFAYTGGATVAAAAAGANVCHVDAAKGMVNQAKANMNINGLSGAPVRYIID